MVTFHGRVVSVWHYEDGQGVSRTGRGVNGDFDLDVGAMGILCQIKEWDEEIVGRGRDEEEAIHNDLDASVETAFKAF